MNSDFWNWSPTNVLHLPQNTFEQILQSYLCKLELEGVLSRYINFEASIDRSYTTNEKVSLTLTPVGREKGCVLKNNLTCDYLVAADGAHSMIRRSLGIRVSGKASIQTLLNSKLIYLYY
jgi:2-polyprenyl-6-methoxyphenol hydroxylase-like FAD-dependent oxidoreductase